jgi:hypothetical protein
MTLKSVRHNIIKMCKACNFFRELNKSRNKFYCAKYRKLCVHTDECEKTKHIVDFWKTEGGKALEEAFLALTGRNMKGD